MIKITISAVLFFFFMAPVLVASEYNTDYCHDPVELQKWEQMLTNNPDSEHLAAIHALWIGLCVKVEARQLTTLKANLIFERFREALVEQIKQQESSADGKRI